MNSQAWACSSSCGWFSFSHISIQGVETKCADAGDLLELLRGHKAADIVHHRRGTRTFPADDRIEQLALFIHQRAVDAEGGDRDAANRAG